MEKYIDNWFSNFKPFDKPLIYQGIAYRTPEHYYQAMKTAREDLETRKYIASLSPGDAKRAGRKVYLRPDWEQIKLGVMETALRWKFRPGTSWHRQLMATRNDLIAEYNNWGDRYWGVVQIKNEWVGENHLGKLLMKIRDEYRKYD